jgi:EAL domain-containing protein (putative c-di-GMP-specific phosphodiesterase class I)
MEIRKMNNPRLSVAPTAEEIAARIEPLTCDRCDAGNLLPFDFTFAFQPIVDINTKTTHSYEALIRGIHGEGASTILSQVDWATRFRFDQLCRAKVITLASQLGVDTFLNINFLVNAVYNPDHCIQLTLEVARKMNFPVEKIILETTEEEKIEDPNFLRSVLDGYRKYGLLVAIDDFGEGYSSLNLLAQLRPEYIKLDRQLISEIQADKTKTLIVEAIVKLCQNLSIKVIGEGVETIDEVRILRDMGVYLFQGYYFARPGFETLPTVSSWEL